MVRNLSTDITKQKSNTDQTRDTSQYTYCDVHHHGRIGKYPAV
jgi:hypothetical protein